MSRTHVILPDELINAVDSLVGKRGRSRFLAEALREKLERLELLKALEETAGVLKEEDHPEWSSSEKVAAWVESLRALEKERRLGD
ncbi:hypothetical protein HKBW3S42_00505 [Candidatus Hakubella thermalkaliphila]|uniref:Ribbon-helix-helix protein CopG domain-containing protein n=2 Tax=Candidatus Hakubella thermalkaliphila TaxID=2754717 RepID=A0A6V8P8C7_9ACTN|nr:ribbon-helix-helix domain-containing protein [Candidatus Hakubella thermalkaliphila]GFP18623.1 hypothetical protein HKBW3S03_00128 [Candidatus Hakubella thermalkaliphila]GFP27924.1 hypothetical protein HKBW3S33_01335 [Candidatus Hakubella thermalkaliphila]GFP29890.1 hypothetical protein HKBW3S34_00810 [Candidatus Hakubella thermalkaliphila]GFP32200.1 hypothetical protein HKBW3S42_00505 [Candidatus Hakubella thermalkaliphila]